MVKSSISSKPEPRKVNHWKTVLASCQFLTPTTHLLVGPGRLVAPNPIERMQILKNFPSVHDEPIEKLATALATSAKALPPLGRITVLVGYRMNIENWPFNRSYLCLQRSLSGELIIGLSHYSEVKHIRTSFRHKMPASLGWIEPIYGEGSMIHCWHKPLKSSAGIAYIAKYIVSAMDDCHIAYCHMEAEHQRLFFLSEESHYFSVNLKKLLDEGKVCSRLPSNVEALLRNGDEIHMPEGFVSAGDQRLHSGKKNQAENWVVINHRGYVTELIQAIQIQGKEVWLGEKDGVAIEVQKPKCGVLQISEEVALQLWNGQKLIRLERARRELQP